MGATGSRKARMVRHRWEEARREAPLAPQNSSSRSSAYEVTGEVENIDVRPGYNSCSALLDDPVKEEPSPRGAHSEVTEGRWTPLPGEASDQPDDQLVKKAANIRLVEVDNADDEEDPKTEVPLLQDPETKDEGKDMVTLLQDQKTKDEEKKEVVTSYWAKINPQATQTTSKAVLVPMDEFGKFRQADKAVSEEGPKGILKNRNPHSDAAVTSGRRDGSEVCTGPAVGRSVSEALPGTLPGILGFKPLSEEELIVKQMKEDGIIKVTDVAAHREQQRRRMLHEVRVMAQEKRAPLRLAPLDARKPVLPDMAAGEQEVSPSGLKGNATERNIPADVVEVPVQEESQGIPDGQSRECYVMDLDLA